MQVEQSDSYYSEYSYSEISGDEVTVAEWQVPKIIPEHPDYQIWFDKLTDKLPMIRRISTGRIPTFTLSGKICTISINSKSTSVNKIVAKLYCGISATTSISHKDLDPMNCNPNNIVRTLGFIKPAKPLPVVKKVDDCVLVPVGYVGKYVMCDGVKYKLMKYE